MIIVSGKLYIAEGGRQAFLDGSHDAIVAARQAKGCRDFVVAADPVEDSRVNVYEEWESEAELESFRGDGPSDDLSSLIVRAAVRQYEVG